MTDKIEEIQIVKISEGNTPSADLTAEDGIVQLLDNIDVSAVLERNLDIVVPPELQKSGIRIEPNDSEAMTNKVGQVEKLLLRREQSKDVEIQK
ncbi:hypothetical protein WKI13_02205 [Teredinibacter turnerae]|uniref:hypothetical protein n=1 Tax=Teredinibacter turnerae TaxID=2426 RepID=UPI000379217E|nr:hypothetical protein [Teredinibacter turnerae]